ncbi:MAG: hypothetical protein U5J82_15325 [Desulfobacterales bacterium]|nr:hypothetical protein [Desulfobacterales bacterium]
MADARPAASVWALTLLNARAADRHQECPPARGISADRGNGRQVFFLGKGRGALPALFGQFTFFVQVRPDKVDSDDEQWRRQYQADHRQHGYAENRGSGSKNQKQDADGQFR